MGLTKKTRTVCLAAHRRRSGQTLRRFSDMGCLSCNYLYFYTNDLAHPAIHVPQDLEAESCTVINTQIGHVNFNGSKVDTRVEYSLNKHKRWQAVRNLRQMDSESSLLQQINMILLEQEARLEKATCMSAHTNFMDMIHLKRDIDRECERRRRHKKKRSVKKQWNSQGDKDCRFKRLFGNNRKYSQRRNFMFNHGFYPFSDPSERMKVFSDDEEAQIKEIFEDFNSKPLVTVGQITPGYGPKNCKFNNRSASLDVERVDRHHYKSRKHQEFARRDKRLLRNDCLDTARSYDDFLFQQSLQIDEEFTDDLIDVDENIHMSQRQTEYNIMDFQKAPQFRRCRKKSRSKSSRLSASSDKSSGYESMLEDEFKPVEMHEEFMEASYSAPKDDVSEVRLLADISTFLEQDRPHIRLSYVTHKTLLSYFCEEQIFWAQTLPMKFAVFLDKKLSEAVVFEQSSDDENHFKVLFNSPKSMEEKDIFLCRLISSEEPLKFIADELSFQESKLVRGNSNLQLDLLSCWVAAQPLDEDVSRIQALKQLPSSSNTVEACCMLDEDESVLISGDCPVCYSSSMQEDVQDFSEKFITLKECGHFFCNYCMVSHVIRSIHQGASAIGCPSYQCKATLDVASVLWLSPIAYFRNWVTNVFNSWLGNQKLGAVGYCTSQKCGSLIQGKKRTNAICVCRTSLCLECHQEGHWPMDCRTYASYLRKIKDMGLTKLNLSDLSSSCEVKAKNCPVCHTILEKGLGCNHMTCRCGAHFCWWCLESMSTHPASPCSSWGKPERAESSYAFQKTFTAADSFLIPSSTTSKIYCHAVKHRLKRAEKNDRRLVKQLENVYAFYQRRNLGLRGDIVDSTSQRWSSQAVVLLDQASRLAEAALIVVDSPKQRRVDKRVVRCIATAMIDVVEQIEDEADRFASSQSNFNRSKTRTQIELIDFQQMQLQNYCKKLLSVLKVCKC